MSRCLDPQTPPEKAFRGSKDLLTRYLRDFGRLGKVFDSFSDDPLEKKLFVTSTYLKLPGLGGF